MNFASTGASVATVILKPRKARPFFGRHPWVLRRAIDRIEGEVANGEVVDLCTDQGRFIARGIYNANSRIAVRLYTWHQESPLDDAFWTERLEQAIACRRQLGRISAEGGCRLVYSEADGLSGLIVDQYADCLVLQINSLAMHLRVPVIAEALQRLLHCQTIVRRSEEGIGKTEGYPTDAQVVLGEPPADGVEIAEHGLTYRVDIVGGQKTGSYLDQCDNRLRVAGYLKDCDVLDLFCYTGGFGLAARHVGQARSVLGIDSSHAAIERARENAERNEVTGIEFQRDKCFRALERLRDEGRKFDAVILDPPKFSRNRYGVADALRAYHSINRLALDVLNPQGWLVTCSCSGGVTREDFMLMLSGVAEKSARDIQVIEQRGASVDHPTRPTCLENEYLKCFICRA